nr:hypothetical protein PJ912_22380 [Pectobacterium colocasium]
MKKLLLPLSISAILLGTAGSTMAAEEECHSLAFVRRRSREARRKRD